MKKSPSVKKPGKSTEVLEYDLTVARVGFGGNTGDGKYYFAFSKHPIHIVGITGPVKMVFTLTEDTPKNIVIINGVSSDTGDQVMIDPKTNGRSASVINTNSKNLLFRIGLILKNVSNGEILICDPQVINVPDPSPVF